MAIKSTPGRERSTNSLERGQPNRSPKDLTLIVCSAESQDYFQSLVTHLTLNSQVTVRSATGEGLVGQVEEALEISRQASPHRRLFALLDYPDSYDSDQMGQIRELARYHTLPSSRIFRLILTTPGFYLWLLLHFDTVDFSKLPAGEWPEQLSNRLEAFIPNPQETASRKAFFPLSYPHLKTAVKQSQNLYLTRSVKPGSSSEIHELIAYLQKLHRRYGR